MGGIPTPFEPDVEASEHDKCRCVTIGGRPKSGSEEGHVLYPRLSPELLSKVASSAFR